MPCAAGPTTSVGRIVPETVAGDGGHAGTPSEGAGFVALSHNQAEIPPVVFSAPKWMCAWVGGASRLR
jgi:hypothetical protein